MRLTCIPENGFVPYALNCADRVVLHGNKQVCFSVVKSARRAARISFGHRVEFIADLLRDNEVRKFPTGSQFPSRKSKQNLNLPAPVCSGKPGMLFKATPTKTASLAFHHLGVFPLAWSPQT